MKKDVKINTIIFYTSLVRTSIVFETSIERFRLNFIIM